MTPIVSIVVPTRNGIATLPAWLEAVASQRFDGTFEVVAVDSSSTDGTAELLRSRVDTFLSIAADRFDHGLTRNLAIESARGELVVLTVQDALPASDRWLAALVAPLLHDDTLAGTFARQAPRPGASALARANLARWVASSETPRTVALNADGFAALTPAARLEQCAFDNVCSCIRRSAWRDHPFEATPIAEDLAWAKSVLLAGHRLAFVPDAVVVHSHDRSAGEEFARTRVLHRVLVELFGLRTIPTLPHLAVAMAATAAEHWRVQPGLRGLALAVAWPCGQYLGGRDARLRSSPTP